MDTSENHNTHQKAETLIAKRNSKEYLSWNPHTNFFSHLLWKKKYDNKKYLLILCYFLLKGLPPMQKLDFGLWARVSPAVLLHLEPTIGFSNWSAVSHPKTRDFRFRWRHFRFRSCDFRLPEPTIHLVRGFHLPFLRNPITNHNSDQGVCMQINVGKYPIRAQCTTILRCIVSCIINFVA